jgi:malate synthase
MNYATWKLNFANPMYGTGPEDKIAELGIGAEGAWVAGELENSATIVGYLTEAVDESKLTPWHVTNISQAEALQFCLVINPEAYLLPNGRITAPIEDRFA